MLTIRDLVVQFGGVRAIDSLSVTVPDVALVGVIGPNGAGKSTLLNAVTGTIRPQAGTIHLGDTELTGRSQVAIARSGIGRTWQAGRLFPSLTVAENVMIGAHRYRRRSEAAAQVAMWVDRLMLGSVQNRMVGELPLGQRRRTVLARALVGRPQVLLLDEPFAGMQRAEKAELAAVVRELAETEDSQVVLIEHDVRLVMETVQHLIVMRRGSLLADGTPESVAADAAVQEEYLGSIYQKETA